MNTRIHKSAQQGFGLLEALVALVLFAGVGLVAISWLQQSLSASVRMQNSLAETGVRKDMLHWIKGLNVVTTPTGTEQIGDYTVEWKAEPVAKMEPQMGYPVGQGRHQVQLYQVTLTARHRLRSGVEFREQVFQAGHIPFNNKGLGVLP
jgi:general secretion pathway protein I